MPQQHITIEALVTDAMLGRAFTWLCRCRKDWPADADVWAFRQRWSQEKARLQDELRAGTYQMSLLTRVTLPIKEDVDLWPARDAVVMKALALVLEQHLPFSARCAHLKGHGVLKGAVPVTVGSANCTCRPAGATSAAGRVLT